MPRAAASVESLTAFEANAVEVAALLKALANERRLMILCELGTHGETTAGSLAGAVGLSQSALSQHLSKMREEGIVAFRREGQTLWYHIADARIGTLLSTLQRLYCPSKSSSRTR